MPWSTASTPLERPTVIGPDPQGTTGPLSATLREILHIAY